MADYTFGIGEELQFTTQDTDLVHQWDLGDGTISILPNPTHAFSTEGIYTVTHLAKDFCDTCTTIGSHTVEITLASITVKSIFLDKYTAKVGDIVTVTVIAQNLSSAYGSSTISINFGGDILGPYSVTLFPDQETTFSADHQVTASGTIDICADNVCTVLFVESMISVKSVTANPSVSTGETITISVTVKNDGIFTEEKIINTTLTNLTDQVTVPIDQRTVTLAPTESQTFDIPLDVRPLPNGVYTVCANGICKAISIAISAPSGNINFTSYPSGAEIWLDGDNTGYVTPRTITDISTGSHDFTLKLSNYNDVVGSVIVTGGITSYVYVNLVPLAPIKGSIAISSVPTNAQILLAPTTEPTEPPTPPIPPTDYGITPITISDLDPGDYDIIIKLSGYQDYTVTITVIQGQTAYVLASLIQTPIMIGSINFTSVPNGAEIWLENLSTGNLEFTGKLTNNTIADLDIGNYDFELRLIGYNNLTGTISVLGGATSYVYANLVPLSPLTGSISISSIPQDAEIWLAQENGSFVNTGKVTPDSITGLTPGNYTAKLKKLGYNDASLPITITAGQTTYVGIILITMRVVEAGIPWWFALSLATGTIYGILKPKKEEEKVIPKLPKLSTPF